ncbi:hypothetical protein [Haloparvum sedimenti]|uniref:hypothetical protein n=1 Tax=Haloparvum sedimenti TaxID=1678448 RepID=UPI00071E9456|nr:hypothetical protein [Haloparvum sedimenti]
MEVVPAPAEGDIPWNQPLTVELNGGEKATVEFNAEQRTNDGLVLPTLAISKYQYSSYAAWLDGETEPRYGPASVPPTDVDDASVTFMPAYQFDQTLTVEVMNLSDQYREYHIQPIGFERMEGQ